MGSQQDRPVPITRRAAIGASVTAVAGGLLAFRVPIASPLRFRNQANEIYDELLRRWVDIVVGGKVSDDNQAYAEAVAAQDETGRSFLASMIARPGSNSPWRDLPLDTGDDDASNMTAVASRLRAIAVPYATPASELHGDAEAAAAVVAGIRVLHDSVYHDGKAQYGNWWDWEIGTPRALLDACVLIGKTLDDDTVAKVSAAIDHFIPDPARMIADTLDSTGANRVDLCTLIALRGALGRDARKLSLASTSLSGVLDPVQTGDGFHPDGSFIMHRVVAYPGTYGELMVRGMAELMALLVDTEWDVANNERDRIVEAIDASYAPFVHRGLMLDSVRGRAISRTGTRDADNGFNLAFGLVSLAAGLPDSQQELAHRFRSLAKGWLQHNRYRPLSARQAVQIATVAQVLEDDSIPAAEDPLGHFPFPDAERITHRRYGWLYSLAMNSDRVARFEYMNGENLKGWHTGDGMVQVYLDDDPYQFTDEFWPTVDAKRLPGTTIDTAPLAPGSGGDIDNEPLTGARLSGMVSLHGGHGAARDGLGLAAMELRGHESPLTARKTWLFLDDGVLAAGSAISTGSGAGRRIETVVDNRNLHSPDRPLDAVLVIDGRTQPDALDETVVHENVRWAHVGDVGGTLFLSRPDAERGQTLSTRREDRTGAWRDLNERGPADPLTRRYLTLWHDHGIDPEGGSYAYLHLPGASRHETEQRVDDPGVEILELSADVHAFRVSGKALASGTATLIAVNFFAAGSAAGITVDAPCAVLVLEDAADGDALRVAVSDPSRSSAVVNVEIDAHRHHHVRETDARLVVLSAEGRIRLLAETGGAHGASLRASFGSGDPAPKQQAWLLEPTANATVRGGAYANENYAGHHALTVWAAASADDDHRAYLAFDLGDLYANGEGGRSRASGDGTALGGVIRAILWLKGAIPMDPGDREDEMLQVQVHAYRLAADDWSVSDITWDTAPGPTEQLGRAWATVYRDWIGIDVTKAVRDAGRAVSLVVAQAEEGHPVILDSRESDGKKPMLEVVVSNLAAADIDKPAPIR